MISVPACVRLAISLPLQGAQPLANNIVQIREVYINVRFLDSARLGAGTAIHRSQMLHCGN
jgi:hypothetical protein